MKRQVRKKKMKNSELQKALGLKVLVGGDSEREIKGCYCGDLLSWVMSKLQADEVWLTVMGNINSIAVAVLSDCACIVLSDNAPLDEDAKQKAESMGVAVYQSEKSTYDLAAEIAGLL